jgi:hypothetical protein
VTDTEHFWAYREARSPFDGLVEACPLIVDDDGQVEGVLVGLILLTDLDGLKERAWTIDRVDNFENPTFVEHVWAAPGHGTIEGEPSAT